MKRGDLIRHPEAHGCQFMREGAKHSLYINPSARKVSTVPRHQEIIDNLCRKICRDLEIPLPGA